MTTPEIEILRNAMQAYALRLETLAANIANLDTPEYRRRSVSFEEQVQDARRGIGAVTDATDIHARVVEEESAPVLEDELMELAETQIRNQVSSRALHEHFAMMRVAITGRSG